MPVKNKISDYPEPVLIHIDEAEFNRNLHLIRHRLIPILNRIKVEFEKIGIEFTGEYLNDILFQELELLKTKVEPHALAGIYEALLELDDTGNLEFEILKDFPDVDESGEIVLTDEAISDLKDFHSTFALTPGGIEIYKAHKKAASALNELYQLVKHKVTEDELAELFSIDNGTISPSFREYDLFEYAGQKASIKTDF